MPSPQIAFSELAYRLEAAELEYRLEAAEYARNSDLTSSIPPLHKMLSPQIAFLERAHRVEAAEYVRNSDHIKHLSHTVRSPLILVLDNLR